MSDNRLRSDSVQAALDAWREKVARERAEVAAREMEVQRQKQEWVREHLAAIGFDVHDPALTWRGGDAVINGVLKLFNFRGKLTAGPVFDLPDESDERFEEWWDNPLNNILERRFSVHSLAALGEALAWAEENGPFVVHPWEKREAEEHFRWVEWDRFPAERQFIVHNSVVYDGTIWTLIEFVEG